MALNHVKAIVESLIRVTPVQRPPPWEEAPVKFMVNSHKKQRSPTAMSRWSLDIEPMSNFTCISSQEGILLQKNERRKKRFFFLFFFLENLHCSKTMKFTAQLNNLQKYFLDIFFRSLSNLFMCPHLIHHSKPPSSKSS